MRKNVITLFALAVAAVVAFAAGGPTGVSSSQSPYLVPSADGVQIESIETVGDPVGGSLTGYRMTGIPDGLGAVKDKGGTFTLLMNHEIAAGGAVRAHGADGAFVSRWTIDKNTRKVLNGSDLIQQIATWNTGTSSYNAPATGIVLSRLCSADLPDQSAFWDQKTKLGYDQPLFMDGEEVAEGRGFAHALDGTSYELAAIGKYAHENAVANPSTGTKTVVVSTDDTTPTGQIYVYVGDKKAIGNPAERAGLTGGTLYGIKVPSSPTEPAGSGVPSGTGVRRRLARRRVQPDAAPSSRRTATPQRSRSGSGRRTPPGIRGTRTTCTSWSRRASPGTASCTGCGSAIRRTPPRAERSHQLLTGTETGGTSERLHMMDNIAVDTHGRIVIQEDPGANDYIARVWLYDISEDRLAPGRAARPDPVLAGIDHQAHDRRGVVRRHRRQGRPRRRLVPARRPGALHDRRRPLARRGRPVARGQDPAEHLVRRALRGGASAPPLSAPMLSGGLRTPVRDTWIARFPKSSFESVRTRPRAAPDGSGRGIPSPAIVTGTRLPAT